MMHFLSTLLVLLLTPALWWVCHRYFRVIFFGSIGTHVLWEILECLVITLVVVSVVLGILQGIGALLLFLLKTILLLAAIGALVLVISKHLGHK